jgi:hypothetical protein
MAQYSLQDDLATLQSLMQPPKNRLFVIVIDDKPEQVAGIKLILEAWPGLNVTVIEPKQLVDTAGIISVNETHADNTQTCQLAEVFNLWLVDENLGDGVKPGREVVEMLSAHMLSQTIFASIESGGNMGGWAKHHFGFKSIVTESHSLAIDFVEFMNKLIAEIGV